MISINEDTVSWVRPERPCKVVGLSLVTSGLSEQEARDALKQAEDETGLPATDVMRFGARVLMHALGRHFASLSVSRDMANTGPPARDSSPRFTQSPPYPIASNN